MSSMTYGSLELLYVLNDLFGWWHVRFGFGFFFMLGYGKSSP